MNLKKSVVAMIAALCLMGLVGCGGSGGGSSDSGGETSPANKAPVASVEKTDIKTLVGEEVYLSADPSSDANNDALTYTWTLEKAPVGSTEALSDPEVANPSFVPDKLGLYLFKLVVNDGQADSEPVYVMVSTGFTMEVGEGVILEFAYIPPGTFTMGSPEDEPGRQSYETQHEVTLTKGYYMMTTELTNRQWETIDEGVWTPPSGPTEYESGPEYPARVPEDKLAAFLHKLNALGQGTFRLPTEAEWERAARAGSQESTAFANGDFTTFETDDVDPKLDAMGWYGLNSGNSKHEVAGKAPNAWGLYDMHGNAYEMCSDLWDGKADYAPEPVVDPIGGSGDPVVRGGAFNYRAECCRSAARSSEYFTKDGFFPNEIGFRLVRDLEAPPVCNPGIDHARTLGETILLDGSESCDSDGYPLSFTWKLVSAPEGNTAELKNADKAEATFQPNMAGYHTFELTVDDGHSEPQSKRVTVDVHDLRLVLFNTHWETNGAMGGGKGSGRERADKLASDNYWLLHKAIQVHAFLSVTEEDCIRNMPKNFGFSANLPVYGSDGVTKVAENWADLLDGSLPLTLEELGLAGKARSWWSGSRADGTLASNCNGWTDGSGAEKGQFGIYSKETVGDTEYDGTGEEWIAHLAATSDQENDVLGIALQSHSVHKPTKLRLFSTKETHKAGVGGREGVNALVRRDPNRPQGYPNAYGFIGVEWHDNIKYLPTNYGFPTDVPITGPDGETIIADTWADLFDGDIKVSLSGAGLMQETTSPQTFWWSGSGEDGYVSETADGWTCIDDGASGSLGDVRATDGTWLDSGVSKPASEKYYFLGVCY